MRKKVIIFILLVLSGICAFTVSFFILGGNLLSYFFSIFSLLLVASACLYYGHVMKNIYNAVSKKISSLLGKDDYVEPIYPILSAEQEDSIRNAVKITFTGDLILLREGVERAYDNNSGSYRFDEMFRHVSDIWKSADLSIGVFEGPMGGGEKGYSNSNYDDGVRLALNFPDSFGLAVRDAGMGLVTLANNHLTDAGIDGAMRTVDVLEKIGLPYVGAYRNESEFNQIKYIYVKGVKVAVLAYTYELNYLSEEFFFKGEYKHLTRPLVSPRSRYFKKNLELVRRDFNKARDEGAQLIIVLPHMGEQFRHSPDKTQKRWCDIFIGLGADIVFSDHPHAVQPLEWKRNVYGKMIPIVHCPGNFVNSYVNHDGDASMIVSVYIDQDSHETVAASVIPIYAHCPQEGAWTGIPVYKALKNDFLSRLSRADYRRIEEVNRLVTGNSLGVWLGIDNIQSEYFTIPGTGYHRKRCIFNQGVENEVIKIGGVICLIRYDWQIQSVSSAIA